MSPDPLVYPLLAQVAWTFVVSLVLAGSRVRAVTQGEVSVKRFRVRREGRGLEQLDRISDHYQNLFELPVLFYALVALAVGLGTASIADVVIAWVFVAARIANGLVHMTYNHVGHRFAAFAAGWVALLVLCGRFASAVVSG